MTEKRVVPVVFTPTSYTDTTKSGLPKTGSGQIMVHMSVSGITVSQIETCFRRGAELIRNQDYRKWSGVSSWYKRTPQEKALWEIIEREKRHTYILAQRVGGTVAPMTTEQAIQNALDEGKSPEDVVALVMALAAARKGGALAVQKQPVESAIEEELVEEEESRE